MDDLSNKEIAEIFREHVTHKETGRIISRRFNIPYLEKNKRELLDQIMHRTSFLDDTFNLRERMFFLDREINEQKYCIVCGNSVHPQFYDGWDKASLSDVCSKECWNKHPNKSEILKEAFKNRDEEVAKIKRAATMKKRFGYEYNGQRPEIKETLRTRLQDINEYAFSKLSDKEWLNEEYNNKKRPLTHIGDELHCYYGTVGEWVKKHGFEIRSTNGAVSYTEIECREYIESLGVTNVSYNNRNVLGDGTELDIYLPDFNLAIEINGVFWHSFKSKETTEEKRKHIKKMLAAKDLGITLLQFWCDEWNYKKDIVKSIILGKLCKNKRIYARKCEIREVESNIAREFFDNNHLSGFHGSSVYVGLYYNNQLMHITSFGCPRYTENNFEIIRSATMSGNTVVGGLSKCLKYFIKKYCKEGDTILTYADRRYTTGVSYEKVGFEKLITKITPNYFWLKNKGLEHRSNYTIKNIRNKFEDAPEGKFKEDDFMFSQGYRRLWDCGSDKFIYVV